MKFICLQCDLEVDIIPNHLYDEMEHQCTKCNDITTHIKKYETWNSPNGIWTISQNDYCISGSILAIDNGYNCYYAHRNSNNVIAYDNDNLPKYVRKEVRRIMQGLTQSEHKALLFAEKYGVIEYKVDNDHIMSYLTSWPQEHITYQCFVELYPNTPIPPKELPRQAMTRYYRHGKVNWCI